ncbi:MAG TPA: transglutaminase-like domain-containing protein [Alphaproteobacteria bacterium]|jgi:regulator of sirC expression with transglutaminase-like and TPR domain|nr:transglutaminase family protein [Micavibrio sp.]HQX27468.1 transglutaminase-like domain-containing protein [Alphaproteobacteria bacterium]
MSFNPDDYLGALTKAADAEIDIGKAALSLAAREQPGVVLERYVHHIQKLSEDVRKYHKELIAAGALDDAATQLAALKHVIVTINNYTGDIETHEDMQNANLLRVIDRRKGMSVTLSVIYLAVAGAQGWEIYGLDFPGHFLCRIDKDGKRLIFDPFYECKILEAPDLRSFVKQVRGENAELSASYFEPASKRDILMRLQNNIKYRQIEVEDYAGALKTVEGMRMIDAGEYRLLLDAGVLYARTGQPKSAIDALEEYIKKAPKDRDRHEAAMLLQELKNSL